MNTANLTRIQLDALAAMLTAPRRSGYGREDIGGTTGRSLAERGLAELASRPEGGKRGTWYALTPAGRDFAMTERARQWKGGW